MGPLWPWARVVESDTGSLLNFDGPGPASGAVPDVAGTEPRLAAPEVEDLSAERGCCSLSGMAWRGADIHHLDRWGKR